MAAAKRAARATRTRRRAIMTVFLRDSLILDRAKAL
jgi:hypothetical protein